MEGEEQAVFEARLKEEPGLADQVEELRILFLGAEQAVLQEKMEIFHEDLIGQQDAKVVNLTARFPVMRYLVAASVVLLVAVAGWWLVNRQAPHEQLYAQYYQPDPGLVTPMSAQENYDFFRAMVDYKSGAYQEAIAQWEGLLEQKPDNDTLSYFLGASYLALRDDQKAGAFFEKVIEAETSAFRQEAFWYRGLSLLKSGNLDQAKEAIRQSNHPEKEAILQQLND